MGIFYHKNLETVVINVTDKTISHRQIYDLNHELIYSHFIGSTIYLTAYNLTMAHLDLNTMRLVEEKKTMKSSQSTPETKDTLKRKEIIRFVEGEDKV